MLCKLANSDLERVRLAEARPVRVSVACYKDKVVSLMLGCGSSVRLSLGTCSTEAAKHQSTAKDAVTGCGV